MNNKRKMKNKKKKKEKITKAQRTWRHGSSGRAPA
jgi:hypothetical protein